MFKNVIRECGQKHQAKGASLNIEKNLVKTPEDQEGRENVIEVKENIIISQFDRERGVIFNLFFALINYRG